MATSPAPATPYQRTSSKAIDGRKRGFVMDSYIGQIMMVAFPWAPRGWVLCDGSLLSVSQNTALFSLLGTTYGGNGTSTFGVPDLRGRVPLNQGAGSGLQPVVMGQMGGEQTVTLTSAQIAPHTHSVTQPVTSGDAGLTDPTNAILAVPNTSVYASAGDANGSAAPAQCGIAGNGQPHDNMPPYTAVNFIICTVGIFPTRP